MARRTIWPSQRSAARRSATAILAVGATMGILTTLALAGTPANYSAVTQFSYTDNSDTSIWSYRYNDTKNHDNNYTLLSAVTAEAETSYCQAGTTQQVPAKFWNTGSKSVPIVGVDKTATEWTFCGTDDPWYAHSLLMHPGPGVDGAASGGLVVVSFLVPADGTATIKFDFSHIQPCSGSGTKGIVWSIDLNASTLASGHLWTKSTADIATTGVRHGTMAVHLGDRINFTVTPADQYYCNSTTLSAGIRVQ